MEGKLFQIKYLFNLSCFQYHFFLFWILHKLNAYLVYYWLQCILFSMQSKSWNNHMHIFTCARILSHSAPNYYLSFSVTSSPLYFANLPEYFDTYFVIIFNLWIYSFLNNFLVHKYLKQSGVHLITILVLSKMPQICCNLHSSTLVSLHLISQIFLHYLQVKIYCFSTSYDENCKKMQF